MSAVTGKSSMLLPLNLYILPLSEGIIRTNCPLSVSCNRNAELLVSAQYICVPVTHALNTCVILLLSIPENLYNTAYGKQSHGWVHLDPLPMWKIKVIIPSQYILYSRVTWSKYHSYRAYWQFSLVLPSKCKHCILTH
jgi:hypothetical protein